MGKGTPKKTAFETPVNPAEKEPWPKVRLGDVCEFYRGLTYSKKDEVPSSHNVVLRSNNIDLETGQLNLEELKYISDSVVIPVTKMVERGSILICMANGSKQHLGKVALIESDLGYAFGGFMGLIKPKEITDSYYLYWVLNSYEFKRLIAGLTDGANINNLKFGDLETFEFPLPPLPVQHSIVARLEKELDAVDRMAKGFEKIAEEADAAFKAELKETFEEVLRRGAETRKLGDVCVFTTSGSRGWAKYQSKSGEYFITIKNVRGGRISLDNISFVHAPNDKEAIRTKVQTGDLLVSITADLGRTGVVTKNIAEHGAYINQHLICLRLNKEIDPYFAAYFVESPLGHKQIYGKNKDAVKAGLNFDSVKSVTIPYLSFSIQRKIVAKLDAVRAWCDKIKRAAEEGVKTTTRLRKAILKEAFE